MKLENQVDWEKLKLFALTVECGSMAEAARRARMTRANVSHQMRALETSLGSQLLRRTTRKRDLTQAGKILYEHVRRMMQESVAAVTAIEELGRIVRGDVRIRLPTGLGHLYLTPLLLDFVRQHPAITLRVNINDHLGDLISAEVDVALKIATDMDQTDVVSRVGPVHWCLCASPDYLRETTALLRPDDLVQHAVITPAAVGRSFAMELNRAGQCVSIPITPRLQSGDYPFLVQAVLAGMGVAMLPRYAVWRQLRDGELVEVLPEYTARGAGDSLFVMASGGRYPSLAAQTLVEFMVRHIVEKMQGWYPGMAVLPEKN